MQSPDTRDLWLLLLRTIYRHTGGAPRALTYTRTLAEELSLSHPLVEIAVKRMANEGFVEIRGIGGALRLSTRGIQELENA